MIPQINPYIVDLKNKYHFVNLNSIKIMFRGFPPCPDPFLECHVSRTLQGEEQPELFFQAVPFIYVNCWTGGRKEENCRWGEKWRKFVGFQ